MQLLFFYSVGSINEMKVMYVCVEFGFLMRVNGGVASEDDADVGVVGRAVGRFFGAEESEMNNAADFLVVTAAVLNVVNRYFFMNLGW